MAGHENENAGKSFWQLMLVIPGTIIGFTLLVSLFAYLVGSEKTEAPAAEPVAAVSSEAEAAATEEAAVEEEVATEDIAPVAEVEVAAAAAAPGEAKSGEEVVKAVCAMCHATGMMESPKIGDPAQWEPRIAQGLDTLVEHAIKGYNMMPLSNIVMTKKSRLLKRLFYYLEFRI